LRAYFDCAHQRARTIVLQDVLPGRSASPSRTFRLSPRRRATSTCFRRSSWWREPTRGTRRGRQGDVRRDSW